VATIDTEIKNLSPAALALPQAEPRRLRYWTWWLPVFALGWAVVFFNAFAEPVALLQRNWPLFFVGFFGAMLGNATAIGGGLVFVPVMILVYHLAPVDALKLAIVSQAFGMTSGAIGWLRRGVPVNGLRVIVPGVLVGATFSTLVLRPNAILIKGLFGPVSVSIGFLTLYLLNRHGERSEIPARAMAPLAVAGLIGGMLSGWVAIGVGQMVAVVLMLMHGLRADRSIGLGVVGLAIVSIYLALLHHFVLGGVPWEMAVFTAFGCVYGARLGPYLSQWVSPRRLKAGFAVVAILDGGILAVQFFLSHVV